MLRVHRLFICITLATLLVIVTCGGCAQAPAAEGEPFVIGYSAALSGWLAPYDTEYLKGIEMAIDEINAQGGVGGQQIELVIKDNNSDASTARVTAQEFVDQNVDALFCTADADPAIPCALIGQEAGIPTFSFASAPSLVLAVPSVFITYSPDNVVAAANAEFAMQQGWETAFLLGSNDIAYTKLIPEYFQEAYERLGGEVLEATTYTLGQPDFNAVVTRIANSDPQPDVIFTPAFPPDSTTFLRQLRAAGVETPVLSTDGNDTPLFLEGAGDAARNTWYSVQGFVQPGEDTSSLMGAFYEDYKEIHGEYPDSTFPALGYDTIKLLAEAIEAAESTEGSAVIEALETMPAYKGATGTFEYSEDNHLPRKEITFVEIVDGALEHAGVVQPEYVPEPR